MAVWCAWPRFIIHIVVVTGKEEDREKNVNWWCCRDNQIRLCNITSEESKLANNYAHSNI